MFQQALMHYSHYCFFSSDIKAHCTEMLTINVCKVSLICLILYKLIYFGKPSLWNYDKHNTAILREKIKRAYFLVELPYLHLCFSFNVSKYQQVVYKINHCHLELVTLKSAFFCSPAILLMSLFN